MDNCIITHRECHGLMDEDSSQLLADGLLKRILARAFVPFQAPEEPMTYVATQGNS